MMLTYFPFHYSLLRLFGLGAFHNSNKKNFRNFSNPLYLIYSITLLGFWGALFPIALWIQVPHIHEMDRLMLNLGFSVTFTFSFIKVYVIIFKSTEIQEIVYSIENEMLEFYQNKMIVEKTITICKRLTFFVLTFANLTVLGLIIGGAVQALWSPLLHKAKNNATEFKPADRILPIPVYLPFEITSDALYSFAFVYQICGVAWCGNMVVLINTFINTIIVHLSGRLSNLSYVLENVQNIALLRLKLRMSLSDVEGVTSQYKLNNKIDTEDLNDAFQDEFQTLEKNIMGHISEETLNNEMTAVLRECIIHHNCIISCVEKTESVYSFAYLTHVINNLNVTCHVMIQMAENDILSIRGGTALTLFLTVVSELLVQCYAGNELTLQASELAESAYNCQWYSRDKNFRQMIGIVMTRAQKPLEVTAGKFVAISNATFVAIMRGGYSLFAVIRSTKAD